MQCTTNIAIVKNRWKIGNTVSHTLLIAINLGRQFKLPAHPVWLIRMFIVEEIQVRVVRRLSLLSTFNLPLISIIIESISIAMMCYYISKVMRIPRHVTMELIQRATTVHFAAEIATLAASNAREKVFKVSLIKQCSRC